MSTTGTVRVMSAEEIAARASPQPPEVILPPPGGLFSQRAVRLRQLAAGHPMRDFLMFVAVIAEAQERLLADPPTCPPPLQDALAQAAREARPALPAAGVVRDPAWRIGLERLCADVKLAAPGVGAAAFESLARMDADTIERQADRWLAGVSLGVDLAAAPLIGAALQVHWAHRVGQLRALPEPASVGVTAWVGRIADARVCPCCGSLPTASLVLEGGELTGQRYLQCSLCATLWHRPRIRCAHCDSGERIAYQSLAPRDADPSSGGAAALGAVQAETCEDCGRYLKIMRREKAPYVDAVADDLASLSLDLLVSGEGFERHGVNPFLIFGEAVDDTDSRSGPPDAR